MLHDSGSYSGVRWLRWLCRLPHWLLVRATKYFEAAMNELNRLIWSGFLDQIIKWLVVSWVVLSGFGRFIPAFKAVARDEI